MEAQGLSPSLTENGNHPVKTDPLLKLIDHYAVPMDQDRLQIRGASQCTVMSGRIVKEVFPKLFPLLDGTRTKKQIVAQMESDSGTTNVGRIVDTLIAKGLVTEVEDMPPGVLERDLPQLETLRRYLGRRGPAYPTLKALRDAHIGIFSTGPVAPVILSTLAYFGVRQVTLLDEADRINRLGLNAGHSRTDGTNGVHADVMAGRYLIDTGKTRIKTIAEAPAQVKDWASLLQDMTMAVVLLDGPVLFTPWLDALNTAAIASGTPWTSVALLDGEEIQIGPTIRPGITACYKCFEVRYKANLITLEAYTALEKYYNEDKPRVDFGLLPPVAEIAAGFAAIEIMRTVSPDMLPKTSGEMIVFTISDFQSKYHPVLKLPRCPACSPTLNRPRQRVWS